MNYLHLYVMYRVIGYSCLFVGLLLLLIG